MPTNSSARSRRCAARRWEPASTPASPRTPASIPGCRGPSRNSRRPTGATSGGCGCCSSCWRSRRSPPARISCSSPSWPTCPRSSACGRPRPRRSSRTRASRSTSRTSAPTACPPIASRPSGRGPTRAWRSARRGRSSSRAGPETPPSRSCAARPAPGRSAASRRPASGSTCGGSSPRTWRRGAVIEPSPSERSRLERGSTVTLVVSRGPHKVEVPSVLGHTSDDAERLIEARGLQATLTVRETPDSAPGTVLEQTPGAGTQVQRGATVTLTVAKAPKPPPAAPKPPPQVKVPDVINDDVDGAVAKLQAAGFTVRKRLEAVDTPADDQVVLDQNPPGGAQRDSGAQGTLVVGRFTPPNLDPEPGATPTPTP